MLALRARKAEPFEAVAARLRQLRPQAEVRLAFLEFMTPDLATAVDALVARGVDAIVVAPVFLAAGGHVLRDLPDRLAAIATRHPGLSVRVEPALGSLPTVLDAMARHCLETLSDAYRTCADAALRGAQGPQKEMDAT